MNSMIDLYEIAEKVIVLIRSKPDLYEIAEKVIALIRSKPIFGASATEQILSSAEREICSNATIGQPCLFYHNVTLKATSTE